MPRLIANFVHPCSLLHILDLLALPCLEQVLDPILALTRHLAHRFLSSGGESKEGALPAPTQARERSILIPLGPSFFRVGVLCLSGFFLKRVGFERKVMNEGLSKEDRYGRNRVLE